MFLLSLTVSSLGNIPSVFPSQSVFDSRRKKLIEEMPEKSIVIIPNNTTKLRNHDNEYKFRPDSDFYYLTGFEEPNAVCVLKKDKKGFIYILFVEPKNRSEEIWTGERAGIKGAKSIYQADRAFSIETFNEHLLKFIQSAKHVYFPFGKNKKLDLNVIGHIGKMKESHRDKELSPTGIFDPRDIIHRMRLIKDDDELASIRQAAKISKEAHVLAMTNTVPGMYEYELEALIDGHFRGSGGVGPAYPSIVASGKNATVLHYSTNNDQIQDGDLILIDAGSEFNYYASDITRTYPAGHRFSPAQQEIYEIVLRAEEEAIKEAKPGTTFKHLHDTAARVIVEGLKDLKLLKGSTEKIIKSKRYDKFFMHGIGHWLGLDVHDACPYIDDKGKELKLKPGMVLTIEPGIYIASDQRGIPKHFRGIGVRIEDDVLITEDGNEVLTIGTPKTLNELKEVGVLQ